MYPLNAYIFLKIYYCNLFDNLVFSLAYYTVILTDKKRLYTTNFTSGLTLGLYNILLLLLNANASKVERKQTD